MSLLCIYYHFFIEYKPDIVRLSWGCWFSNREPVLPDNRFGYGPGIILLWADYELIIILLLGTSQLLFSYHQGAVSLMEKRQPLITYLNIVRIRLVYQSFINWLWIEYHSFIGYNPDIIWLSGGAVSLWVGYKLITTFYWIVNWI